MSKLDIIDYLTNDHNNLRQKLSQIRQNLEQSYLRSKIREFIADFEIHETIEDNVLYPGIRVRMEELEQFINFDKETHKEIWKLLEWMTDCLNKEDINGLERALFYFSSEMDTHMEHEERVLFSIVKRRLDRDSLELLLTKAEERYLRSAA